jgi:RimJ/RimL family protein N-acetyltransferase
MKPALVHTPVLETERLTLRAPQVCDFDAYAGFFASSRSAFVGGTMDRARAWRFFGHHVGHWSLRSYGTFFLVPKTGGPVVGMVMAWQPEGHPERELGWAIFSDEHAGRGYATEGAARVRDHVLGTLDWPTAVSYIHADNAASIALAERLGARPDAAADRPGGEPCLVYRHVFGAAA